MIPPDIVARLAQVCDAFVPRRALRRSSKCLLVAGVVGEQSAVAKVLFRDDAVWSWYLAREALIYPALPSELGAPAVLRAHPDSGVLIMSRVRGRALAANRSVRRPVEARTLEVLLERTRAINRWEVPASLPPRPRGCLAPMRRRLLEDPDAPRAWFVEGVSRCQQLGIVDAADAARLIEIFHGAPLAACHGDLLPRNVVAEGEQVAVLDWECAGTHLAEWDRALLWANVDDRAREHIEADAAPSFWATAAFAVAREIAFAREGSTRAPTLRADLAAALSQIT